MLVCITEPGCLLIFCFLVLGMVVLNIYTAVLKIVQQYIPVLVHGLYQESALFTASRIGKLLLVTTSTQETLLILSCIENRPGLISDSVLLVRQQVANCCLWKRGPKGGDTILLYSLHLLSSFSFFLPTLFFISDHK